MFGVELRVVDDDGNVLPRDGESSGRLQCRGAVGRQALFQKGGGRDDDEQLVRYRRRCRHPSRQHDPDHRPRQGRDQVGRRVDQLDRARECGGRLPGRRRSRGDRHSASQMGRAAVAADRPRRRQRRQRRRNPRPSAEAGRHLVDARRDRVRRRASAHRRPASCRKHGFASSSRTIASRMPRRWSAATRRVEIRPSIA